MLLSTSASTTRDGFNTTMNNSASVFDVGRYNTCTSTSGSTPATRIPLWSTTLRPRCARFIAARSGIDSSSATSRVTSVDNPPRGTLRYPLSSPSTCSRLRPPSQYRHTQSFAVASASPPSLNIRSGASIGNIGWERCVAPDTSTGRVLRPWSRGNLTSRVLR